MSNCQKVDLLTLSPDQIGRPKEYKSQDCKKRGEGSIVGLGIWRDRGLLAETQILLQNL